MTEPKKTQKQNPKNSKTSSGEDQQRRLLRSPNERMLTGVAGGIAAYLGVDPTFVRLGFVAATLFGGFGILVYLVMAVITPEDDGSGNPVSNRRPPTWALVLLGIAVLVVLPGPFVGWGDGWFFGAGVLWLVALLLAGAAGYRVIRGRWPGQAVQPEAATAADVSTATTTEAAVAGSATRSSAGAPPRIVRLLAYGLLGLLVLGAALSIAAVGAWATATGNGSAVAGIVIALGVALAATAFFTDAARAAAPWLIATALVLAIPAGAVAAADVRFDGAIGERDYTPTSVADIPDGGYELGVGQLKVDLRELDWRRERVVSLRSELGVGQMVISVPSEVCVTGHADAKAGELLVRGDSTSGVDPEFDRGQPAADLPRLVLDGDLQLGQLVVTDRDPEDYDSESRHDDSPDEIAAPPEACSP